MMIKRSEHDDSVIKEKMVESNPTARSFRTLYIYGVILHHILHHIFHITPYISYSNIFRTSYIYMYISL